MCSTRCGPFSASGCGGLPPLPLVGPHSCHSGLCRPLVFCPLSSFPGRFVLIPGFCHLSIPLFFWPGEASMVLSPWPVTLSFSGRPALTSAALCPDMSTKSCYAYLLSKNMVPPQCVVKFSPMYGSLDWPSTWRLLTFFELDHQVTDLCWKIAHGVLYTAQRLVSFGLSVPPSCFCGSPVESLEHLFFYCPLAQSVLSWLQSLLFSFSFMCPALLCRHVLFGLSSDELVVTPQVFVYLLNLCKYFILHSRNDFRFRAVHPGAAAVIARVKSRLGFHLPIFFKRFQSARRRRFFHHQWGVRGVVATVSDGHLSLAL